MGIYSPFALIPTTPPSPVVINPLGAVVVVDADATRPRPSNRLARHAR